jgi:hypothetical protein
MKTQINEPIMKTASSLASQSKIAASLALCLAASLVGAQSIPEPGLLLYGQVRNTTTGSNLLTYGTLRWTIQPPGAVPPITLFVPLTNINDQFSYVLRVPFETPLAGFTLSPNTLVLSSSQVTYSRTPAVSPTGVTYTNAAILSPALTNFNFSAGDRGRSERVDLQVTLGFLDTDNDGLDDNWEMAYFDNLSRNGAADFDGDGMSDFAEYKAGTDPKNAQSLFAFIGISPDPLAGIAVQWSSVASKSYTVQRSSDLLTGFANLQTNIAATPGTNYLRDATATNRGPYFYRIRLE